MGPQDGVDVVVRVAHHVVHQQGRKDIRFALLGYGDCLDSLRDLRGGARRRQTTSTSPVGPICKTIAAWLSTADVGISPDPYTPFNDVSTMNKTLEYMAYELPVVAFELTETVVSAGAAAAYVTPSDDAATDVAAMANAVTALVDDPSRRREMGRIGRARIVDELGWPTSAIRYRDVVRRLTGRPTLVRSAFSDGSGMAQGRFSIVTHTEREQENGRTSVSETARRPSRMLAEPSRRNGGGNVTMTVDVPRLVAIVVTFNSAAEISGLLASLGSSTVRPVKTVVVDNASTDGTLDLLRRSAHPGLEVLELTENVGYGAAINRGAERAGADSALLVLNPDVELRPTCVAEMVAELATTGASAASCPDSSMVRVDAHHRCDESRRSPERWVRRCSRHASPDGGSTSVRWTAVIRTTCGRSTWSGRRVL